ncbi:MAG TPA: BTAD domain-containing putative transcriptional regulator [Longimicrobiales bacterium]|nr:BTAD domain-containing putative transcriptional regulator [Longimicrobiales bacterium]
MDTTVRLRTLGATRVERSNPDGAADPAPIPLQPKLLALLAYLAVARPQGPQRRDALVALFWPELDQGAARNALSQALYRLRTTLGPGALVSRGNELVEIDPDRLACDVWAFDTHLDAGRLEDALALYQGDFLPGLHTAGAPGFERWLDEERRTLRRRAREAALQLGTRAEEAGNVLAAVRSLERALELQPADEHTVRHLMVLMDRAGDRAGAQDVYQRLERHLDTEFDLSPASETRDLAESLRQADGPSAEPLDSPPGGTAPARPSGLAVLPLVNLSADPSRAYLADGMTETLTGELATVLPLRVISRQSVLRFRNTDRPLPEIAGALGVDLLVEGSVLSVGGRVRITVQLLAADPERHLWSGSFDGDEEDLLSLQRTVARSVASEVERRLGEGSRPPVRMSSRPAVSGEAYDEFLRGIAELPFATPRTFDAVVGRFERAGELDPGFGEALAWAAFAWINAAFTGIRGMDRSRTRAWEALEKALVASPDHEAVHAVHATWLCGFEMDWAGADQAFERARALGGAHMQVYGGYVLFLIGMGRFAEAEREADRLAGLNPFGPPEQVLRAMVPFFARDHRRALKRAETCYAGWPDYHDSAPTLAEARLFGGHPAQAAELAREWLAKPSIPPARASFCAILARTGDPEPARALLAGEALAEGLGPDLHARARLHLALGQVEEALRAVERIPEEGSTRAWQLPVDPLLDELRTEARFRRILKRLSLPS